MKQQIIFFHGGGSEEDYKADGKLVASLKSKLGSEYTIHYPLLVDDGTPDMGRRKQIGSEISTGSGDPILVAHSFGASMLLAALSESKVAKNIKGIFLIATPFWTGSEDWVQPYKLKPRFEDSLDKNIPLFLYHAHDDEEIAFEQFEKYKKHLTWATFRDVKEGGHQLNDDLTIIAEDIEAL